MYVCMYVSMDSSVRSSRSRMLGMSQDFSNILYFGYTFRLFVLCNCAGLFITV